MSRGHLRHPLYCDPKVIAAKARDLRSVALYGLLPSWGETTDQPWYIPVDVPGFLVGARLGLRLAGILEDVGLLHPADPDGWIISDWDTPGDALELEVDHVMPRALGGKHVMSNLQLLCGPCNRRKYAKHPAEWMMEVGR